LLVLLAALFNYLLFSAGRMFNRRKELGIRELHGATSGRLLQLFMVEITLTLLITGVIAAAMLELISMYFAGEWTYYMNFSEGGSWVIKMGGDLAEYLIGVWLLMLVVGYGIIRQVRQATMLRNLQGGGIAYRDFRMDKIGIVRVDTIIVQRHFFLFLHTFYPITFRVYHPGSE